MHRRAGKMSLGMDYEDEFERLARQGTDYDELLRFGSITRQVDDPDAWRSTLKAKARADRLRIRTGALNDQTAWAALTDRATGVDDLRLAFARVDVQEEAEARATLRGHTVERWLRAEGSRAIARCARCGRRLYVDVEHSPPVIVGEVFEDDCP